MIHGIPSSYQEEDFSVPQMEVYIGCARSDRLFQRFSSHFSEKKHEFGVIVGACNSNQADYLESTGIKLLKKIEKTGKLCVRNASVIGYKNDGNDELTLIYMTWKIDRRKGEEWVAPSKMEREEIYKEVLVEVREKVEGGSLSSNWREHIKAVVEEIHKKTARETVYWHPRHR